VLCQCLKDFLKHKFSHDSNLAEQSEIYNKIGNKYELLDDKEKAIQFYLLAGNMEKLIPILEERVNYYAGTVRGKDFSNYIYSVPEEYVKKSSTLCFSIVVDYVMRNKMEDAEEWLKNLVSLKDKTEKGTKEYNKLIQQLIVAYMLSPNISVLEAFRIIKNLIKDVDEPLANTAEKITLTFNYPSVISGVKDLTSFCRHPDLVRKYIKPAVQKEFDYDIEPIIDIGYGEYLFTRTDFSNAMNEIGNGMMYLETRHKENLELLFVAHVTSMKNCFASHQLDLFEEIAEELRKKLEASNETQLLINFKAVYARLKLASGDTTYPDAWLKNEAVDITEYFNMAYQYVYTTKIIIEMSKRKIFSCIIRP